MSTDNIKLLHRWFEEVWNKGRADGIDEMFAADGITYGLGEEAGVDVHGPAAFKPFLEKLRGAFPNIEITIEDAIASGDKVAARWSARMTHQGDHLGLAATDNPVAVSAMSFARIADGKIVKAWNNWNIFGMMQQIGVTGREATLLEP